MKSKGRKVAKRLRIRGVEEGGKESEGRKGERQVKGRKGGLARLGGGGVQREGKNRRRRRN